jgi:hypothetical protein
LTERRRSTKKAKRISNEDNGATKMLQIRGGSVVSVDGGGGGGVRWLWKGKVVGGGWLVVEVVVGGGRGSWRKLGCRVMRQVANREGSESRSLLELHKSEVEVTDFCNAVTSY